MLFENFIVSMWLKKKVARCVMLQFARRTDSKDLPIFGPTVLQQTTLQMYYWCAKDNPAV